MCRWVAYSGNAIRPAALLYDTPHSLVEQSRRDRLAGGYPNADGFGLGWYGDDEAPGLYRSIAPAWGDRNLHEIATRISTPLFLAHIRAATGTPIEQTNCHPFRHGRWLFMHNGFIEDYQRLRRDLLLAVDPRYFGGIEGTTDSELMFHLALTYGLEDDPVAAVSRTIGLIEAVGSKHGVEYPMQGTVCTTDGTSTWAFRYSSEGNSRSLFFSTDVRALRELHPEIEILHEVDDEARLIVSEPLGDLAGAWNEVPESSYGIVQPGQDVLEPFTPVRP